MESLQFGIYVDLVLGGACFSFPVLACVAMHKPEYPQAIRKLLVLFSVSHWCCGLTQICRALYLYDSPILLGVLDTLKVITVIVVVLTSISLWNSLPQLLCFHFHNNNTKITNQSTNTNTNANKQNNQLTNQITNKQTYEQTSNSINCVFSNSKHNQLNTTTDSLVLPTTINTQSNLNTQQQTKPRKNTKHDSLDSLDSPVITINACSPCQTPPTTPTCSEQDESEISTFDDDSLGSPVHHQKLLTSPPVVPLRATKSCEDLSFAFPHLQVQFQKQRKMRDKAKRDLLKKSNEALTKEKLRWQAVWDVTPLMLWLIAPNGDVVKFNRLWYEYTGLTEPECVVTSGIVPDLTRKLLPPEEVKDYLAEWFRCLEKGTTFELKARFKRHADGEYRWHLVTTVPVRDPETQAIIQWCGGAADIHDAEVVAKLIAEDARRKCRFLATISHEMRTPLNGILGMTTCLRDTQLQPAQVDLVNNVSQCADQLLVLINNILDLIQIKKKRVHLEDSVFTVREVIQDALSIVVEQAVNKQLSISTDITMTKPIRTDYKRLRQILINLLTNAVKFTPTGGMIVVGTTSITQDGRQYVCFSVKDSGIGIPEEDMPKLYGMFSQVDSQGVRPFGGSGLGLAIAKGIVTLLRGNIWCESKVGKGTTFYFTCPIPDSIDGDASDLAVLQSPIITSSSNSLPSTPPLLVKKKESSPSILVVDDNHLNQTVLKRTLESIGFSDVAVAGDGAEALEMVKMHSYDVIFMDVEMPVMDGTVSTTLIRSFSETLEKQPHIIAVTANSVDDEVEKCFEAGMCRHMAKPIRRDTIRKCIDEYLSLIYPGLQCCRCTSNATTTTTTNTTITPTSNTVQIQQTTTIQTQTPTPKKLLFEPSTGAELLIPEVTSKTTTTGYSILKQQCIPELQLATKNSKTKFNSTLQQQRESPIITTKTFPSRVLTHRRSYKPEQPVN